jgi:glycosyltransferase involved in cell wall biosynthesis
MTQNLIEETARRSRRQRRRATRKLTPTLETRVSRAPRLAHVVPWDLTVGGIQRMVSQWCQVEGASWDVHVVSPGARGAFEFPGATVHAGVGDPLSLLAALAPDLLVHHGPSIDYGRYAKCPVVWVVHSELVFGERRPNWCEPSAVLSNFPPAAADCGPGWEAATVEAIPLGVDVDRFTPRLVAGVVGRISEEKIPRSFAASARRWGNPGARWELRFVGQGVANGYQPWLRATTKDLPWVTFTGDLAPEAMPNQYPQLDVLLVPSMRESGSYAIVEAMAAGLPVVARAVGGVPFTAGEGAWLVKEDDAFFEALDRLTDAASRERLGTKAREEAVARHELREHARRQSVVFRAALGLPEVDVLMPVFNTPATWLREAWDSILSQTYPARRVVIVDDGSTDEATKRELATIASDERALVVRHADNRGIAAALNTGLAHCTAPYVARMDADDVMEPQRLFRQARYVRDHTEVDVLGAQMTWSEREGQTRLPAVIDERAAAATDWLVNHPTALLKRQTVAAVGGYPDYRMAQDLALWLTLVKRGAVIHNLPEALVRYRCHAGQTSAQGGHAATIQRIRKEIHE